MTIRVTHPSGSTIEFPDGTDQETIAGAMRQLDGSDRQMAEPEVEQPAPYQGVGEVAGGLARSAGVGLLQGAIGLGTLPGNVEALARAGINRGAGVFGLEPPVNPDTWAINYNDLKGRVEGRFGKFYEPKTRPEKYVRTLAEFAPMAAIGGTGSAMARVGQVAAPAIVSETAGQATEGTSFEPWARIAGALAGGAVANAARRTVTPAGPTDAVRANQVQELHNNGVTSLTAGQMTGNQRIRQLEDATLTMPGGGQAQAMQTEALEQFTSAALQQAGVQGATRATPDVLEVAHQNLGHRYNQIAGAATVVADRGFPTRLQAVVNNYNRVTPEAQRIPIIQEVSSEIARRSSVPGGMTGQQYVGFRSELRRAQRGMNGNPHASEAIGRTIEHLDAQMIRSAPRNIRPQVVQFVRQTNEQYRNLLAIEAAANKAGERAAAGLISPAQLNAELKRQTKRIVARHNRDIGRLAAAGDAVLRDLKSSGTAERNAAISMLKSPAAMASSIGTGGWLSGGDPLMMAASAGVPYLMQVATARGVTNPFVQRWLGNQLVPGRVNTELSRRSGMGLAPFIMQEYGNQ